MESRTQGSRLRPRTQKKSEAKAKASLSEDRHSRGPKTQAQVLSKKKKVFTKIFPAISTKKRFPKNISSAPQNFNNSKTSAVLEPSTGQFSRTWGLEAKDFKMCPRGLHLWLLCTAKHFFSEAWHAANKTACSFNGLVAACIGVARGGPGGPGPPQSKLH